MLGGTMMKIKTLNLILSVLFIASMACSPAFIDQYDKIRVNTDSNIYSGPGPNYKRITTVKAGTELVLLESENDWHRVRLSDGRSGWIFRGITRTVGPEKIIVIEDARVRRGPGEQYSAFAIVKKGKTVDSRGDRNNYYLVDLPTGHSGWILKTQAEKVSHRNLTATERANIYQLPSPNSQVLLKVDAGAELVQLNREGDYYLVRLRGGDTGWIHEDYVNTLKEKTILVKERADVKYGPSIEYDAVQTVEKGTRLTLLLKRDDWYKVRTPHGNVGWIYKEFVVQTFATQEVGVSVEDAPLYVITNTDCNIRQGYGTNWPKIAEVKKGTILVKIGQRDNWLRIRMPNQGIGWIREDLVEFDPIIHVTIDECNIRLGPSTNFRVLAEVPKATPLVIISEENDWSRVYLPNGDIGWIRNDLHADVEGSLFAKQDCNVREGPGTNYRRIDRIKAGTPVIELEKQDNWYKVELPSKKEGWIREDLLRDTLSQMVTTERVNIRLGPGTQYRVLTELEKNTPITVIGEQDDWYRIKLPDDRIGWIRKDLVTYSFYPTTSSMSTSNETYSFPLKSETSTKYSTSSVLKPFSASSSRSTVKMTTKSNVNLRIGPSVSDERIKLLPAGTRLTRIDKRGEWYEVQTDDGILGFVHESGFSSGSNKIYTNTKSNVRLGPSTDYRIITTLPEKAELTKIEQRDDWIYVTMSNGQKGWVQKDLVDRDSSGPAPMLPQKTESVSGTLITNDDGRILKGPGESYPTVRSVKKNTQLKMISKYKDWYEVETLAGDKGWITEKLVQEKDDKKIIVIRQSEVHENPNTQSTYIAVAEVGNYYPQLGKEGGWYRIPVKAGVTGWIVSRDVMELKHPAVYVNASTADIQKFADEKSDRLAIVKEGVKLKPIDETDVWLFVQLPRGDKGWIKKRFVNRQKHPRIRVVRDTEAYEEPNAGSLLKAKLIKGDQFLALGINKNWYKILLRGAEVGWVYSGHVNEVTKGTLLVRENSHLRMGPGLDYRIIGTVPGSERLKWLAQDGDWNQVQLSSGEVGWIFEKLAKNVTMPEMTAQANSPVYAGSGTNFARVGQISRGRKYAPITKRNGWYQIQLSGGTEGWVPANVFSPNKSRLVFTLDKANIRSGPGLHYSVVQVVQPAVDLTVIGSEGDWYHVQLQDGTKGYILKDLIFEER